MAKYYIFRHAQTFASKYFVDYEGDNFSTPILHEGKEAILKMANYLKDIPSDFNVSSPYLRCKQTVEIISQVTGKEFIFDDRIGEYYQIEYPDFRARVVDFLEELKKKNYQSVVICTHGAVISVLMHLLFDKIPEQNIPFNEYKKTGVLVIIKDGNFQEIDFND